HRLPDVFDIIGVFAGEKWGEVFIDSRDYRANTLRERRTTDAVKARLACLHFHNTKSHPRRRREDRFDLRDLERRLRGEFRNGLCTESATRPGHNACQCRTAGYLVQKKSSVHLGLIYVHAEPKNQA